MIFLLLGLILFAGAASAAAAILKFWPQLMDSAVSWLQARGLKAQSLRKLMVRLDRTALGVRGKLMAATGSAPSVVIEERTFELDEIRDPDILRQLNAWQTVEVDLAGEV